MDGVQVFALSIIRSVILFRDISASMLIGGLGMVRKLAGLNV
jgi:hypothetical protein